MIAFGFYRFRAVALSHDRHRSRNQLVERDDVAGVPVDRDLAFLFVPINTISYAGVKPEQNNQVSGLMNLMRNIGGSVGISLTGAMITERAQFHQHQLVQNATAYNPQMRTAVAALGQTLAHAGLSTPDAARQAYGRIYLAIQGQAQTLAYIDTFWMLAIAALCMVPLVFLLKRIEPGKAPAGAH